MLEFLAKRSVVMARGFGSNDIQGQRCINLGIDNRSMNNIEKLRRFKRLFQYRRFSDKVFRRRCIIDNADYLPGESLPD